MIPPLDKLFSQPFRHTKWEKKIKIFRIELRGLPFGSNALVSATRNTTTIAAANLTCKPLIMEGRKQTVTSPLSWTLRHWTKPETAGFKDSTLNLNQLVLLIYCLDNTLVRFGLMINKITLKCSWVQFSTVDEDFVDSTPSYLINIRTGHLKIYRIQKESTFIN